MLKCVPKRPFKMVQLKVTLKNHLETPTCSSQVAKYILVLSEFALVLPAWQAFVRVDPLRSPRMAIRLTRHHYYSTIIIIIIIIIIISPSENDQQTDERGRFQPSYPGDESSFKFIFEIYSPKHY